jgi:hypothetical protein
MAEEHPPFLAGSLEWKFWLNTLLARRQVLAPFFWSREPPETGLGLPPVPVYWRDSIPCP